MRREPCRQSDGGLTRHVKWAGEFQQGAEQFGVGGQFAHALPCGCGNAGGGNQQQIDVLEQSVHAASEVVAAQNDFLVIHAAQSVTEVNQTR